MAAYTAIDDPEANFQAVLWTGTGSSNAITLGGDTDMSPNLVWGKGRSNATSPAIHDSVRGATLELYSSSTAAEGDYDETLKSFDSDGFTVGTDNGWNGSSRTFVAWCWKAGTSFSNDASATSVGSVDSTGSINTTSGFSIIRWSGTGANATIAHGIAAPKMMIIKRSSGGTESWVVYHQAISPAKHVFLNSNDAENADTNNFQDTATTSSVFSVGTYNQMNASGTDNMIAYCFAEKQGFSKFGSYTGNGNVDGTFIYTGFRPAYVLTKSVDSTSSWEIFDNKREGYNVDNDALVAEATTVEATADQIDLLSNGFKCRIATDPNVAETYIYAAFAEAPFVNSNGVPCNAR
jgi:hypothetical protein